MAARLVRPRGITVLVLLGALEGAVLLLGGLLLLIFSGLVGGVPSATAGLLLVSAIFNFIVAYGYWNGFGWAWWGGLILAIIGAIGAILMMPLGVMTMALSLIINGLIIYYLTQPYVQEYFGRSRPLSGGKNLMADSRRLLNASGSNARGLRAALGYCSSA